MALVRRQILTVVVSVAFFHLSTAAFIGPRSSSHHCCWSCRTNSCHSAIRSDDAASSDEDAAANGLDAALRCLDLTPAQALVVQERLEKVGLPATTTKNNNNTIEGNNINLSWLSSVSMSE
jgi:hypothetical protein